MSDARVAFVDTYVVCYGITEGPGKAADAASQRDASYE
jgi:hypothetical protein